MEASIYVLPTEENLPPRALLMDGDIDLTEKQSISGTLATWNADMGAWCVGGVPLSQEVSDAITEHAKSLGVEWD